MAIKRKPLWLRWTTQPHQWVAISPNIYAPEEYHMNPFSPIWDPLIKHEEYHLARQNATGLVRWLSRYALDKGFRLDEECRGAAVELSVMPEEAREARMRAYASDLVGPAYRNTAPSFGIAYELIRYYLKIFTGVGLAN